MEQEIWQDVVWYEGLYQISNLGNVKRLWFQKNILKEKILKFWKSKSWYLYINLYINGIRKYYLIHRLVCMSFLNNINNKPHVNHKNWIKSDNRLENLEWCTRSENMKHRFDILWHKTNFQTNHPYKWKFWKDNPKSRKVHQYNLEWNFIKEWDSIIEAQRELKIRYSGISTCCSWKYKTSWGFIWKYISS